MEQLAEILKSINIQDIGVVIIAVIAVTKGFTTKFNILNGRNKELVTLLFSLAGFVWLLFKGNVIVDLIGLFVVIYFGASGIYNFIPVKKEDIIEIPVDDIPEDYKSIDVKEVE